MWRPEGWDASIILLDKLKVFVNPRRADKDATRLIGAVEAGADAMLEALKKEGKYIDASKYPYGMVLNDVPPIQKLTKKFKGYIVIIPDEC